MHRTVIDGDLAGLVDPGKRVLAPVLVVAAGDEQRGQRADRARLVRGTFDMLGMWSTQIGIGTDGGPGGVGYKDTFSDTASGYMSPTFSERTFQLQPGRQVLHAILAAAAPKSVSLLLISSLKDVALFLRDNQDLFVRKVKEVSVMGGVKPFDATSEGKLLEPDSAHNNEFDAEAAARFGRCAMMTRSATWRM